MIITVTDDFSLLEQNNKVRANGEKQKKLQKKWGKISIHFKGKKKPLCMQELG